MIYVLGGEGFVGSAYARLFQRLGLEHLVISRANYHEYQGSACEVLIDADGRSGKIMAARDPLADFEANVRSVRASLEDFKAGFYILLSSCDVYPDCSGPETTREDGAIDLAAQSPYGFHKFMAENCVRHRAENWLIIRQGGFVGPGLKKNAVFDILAGGPLWLDPESQLQFLHTDASAALVWALYRQGLNREVFNLCGAGLARLKDAAAWAGRAGGPPARPGSPRVRYEVSLAKAAEYVSIPSSADTVKNFIEGALRDAAEAPL